MWAKVGGGDSSCGVASALLGGVLKGDTLSSPGLGLGAGARACGSGLVAELGSVADAFGFPARFTGGGADG